MRLTTGYEIARQGERPWRQIVHQGIPVYRNKGSSDQHAYVQQLRDITMPRVDAFSVDALITLYDPVGFYGPLVNVNAYDEPGVEAGQKAATELLQLQSNVRTKLSRAPQTAGEIRAALPAGAESVYQVLEDVSANDSAMKGEASSEIADDKFLLS